MLNSVYLNMLQGHMTRLMPINCVTEQTYTFSKDDKEVDFTVEPIVDPVVKDSKPIQLDEISDVLTAFSGCDCVLVFGDKIIGEASLVEFSKLSPIQVNAINGYSDYYDRFLVSQYPCAVKCDATLFDRDVVIEDDTDIIMCFANEYGKTAYRVIRGIKLLKEDSGMSIDTVVMEKSMYLAAKDITPLTNKIKVSTGDTLPADCIEIDDNLYLNNFINRNNTFVNRCIIQNYLEKIYGDGFEHAFIPTGDKIENIILRINKQFFKI